MQKLEKIDFKIKVIPSELEKYMSFSHDNKLVLIEVLHRYILVTNLDENNFKHFS